MDNSRVLFIGYRGKRSHILSAQKQGVRTFLLIGAEEMKPTYQEEFEEVFVVDDIYDWRQVAEAIKGQSFDAVLTRYEDFTVIAAAIAHTLDLPSTQFENAPKFRNKYLMRQAFAEHGVPSADFILIASPEDAKEFIKKNQFPLILKQVAGIHSKYVTKVHSEEELRSKMAFFKKSINENAGNLQRRLHHFPIQIEEPDPLEYFLLEECMTGLELTLDAFVSDGTIYYTPICKYVLSEDLGFKDHHLPIRIMPYDLSDDEREIIEKTVARGLRALGTNFCVTHSEVFYNPQTRDCRIIEIAARGGGFRGEMVRHVCGGDYDLGVVRSALGLPPHVADIPKKHVAVVEVFAEKNGILEAIDASCLEDRDDVFSVTRNRLVGDMVGLASDGQSFVLKFLLIEDSYKEVEKKGIELLRKIRSSIQVKEITD